MRTCIFLSLTLASIIFSMHASAQITAWGTNALAANTTGTNNSAFGYNAMATNTTGSYNSAIGIHALRYNTIGTHNVANGPNALLNNTIGYSNTASGSSALGSNTEGSQNSAFGHYSLLNNQTGLNNTGIGDRALYSNVSGNYNTAIGTGTLHQNTASNNSAFGANALYTNSNGNNNSAVGLSALYKNTVGSYNTALGAEVMYNNEEGNSNVGIGYNALKVNTHGSSNIAIGVNALYNNLTGGNNIVVGYNTGLGITSGSNNTIIGGNLIGLSSALANTIILADGAGNQRLYINSSGQAGFGTTSPDAKVVINSGVSNNSGLKLSQLSSSGGKYLTVDASGVVVLVANNDWSLSGNAGTVDGTNFIGTTDLVPLNFRINNQPAGRIDLDGNTVLGHGALLDNISAGTGNTVIGNSAMFNNGTGSNNTAVGKYAVLGNATGTFNTGVGFNTLGTNNYGDDNTAIGGHALVNVEGSCNTGVGAESLAILSSGDNNTAVGCHADVSSSGTGFNNSTAIGSYAIVNASNKVRIGDVNVTVIEGQPAVYTTTSDGRFKTNLSENDIKGLQFIRLLRPVVYNYDTRKFEEFLTKDMPDSVRQLRFRRDFSKSTAIRHSGFIAQEVEEAAKKAGYDFDGIHRPSNENDNYSLAYGQFVVPLVKSVQELSKVIDEQQETITSLKKEMIELRSMIMNKAISGQEGSINITVGTTEAKLFQNAPNPFNKATQIRYSIPVNAKKAIIIINTIDGQKIKEYDLRNTKGQNIEISGGQLSAGNYVYSLIVDDILIDSKVMILTR
jgi:trimeric autotransporter adhesin